jgi:CRP-like cAMP-binding protein
MSRGKDRMNAWRRKRVKPRGQPPGSSETFEMEPTDLDDPELVGKRGMASVLKPELSIEQCRASRRKLMKLAARPDELSDQSAEETMEHIASHMAYLNLADLVDVRDGSETAAEAAIKRLSKTRSFAAGEVIHRSRSTKAYLAILRSGSIKLVFEYNFFGYKPIHILIKRIGPGAVFGNMPVWGQTLRKATVIAVEPCEVDVLDKRGADALLDSSFELLLRLSEITGPKLYELKGWEFQRLCKKWGYEPKDLTAETET